MMATLEGTAGPLRVGLFNVKYSPNLGDGILSECLEAELRRAVPGSTVVSLDLAGRHAYAKGTVFRTAVLRILERSPAPVRRGVVFALLGRALRANMRPSWRRALREMDAVVVGGGNLFVDADLNFPLKVDAALDETRQAGLPAAVFGVGVSDNWSPEGEALFRRAVAGVCLVYASVRDRRSAAIWERRLGPVGIQAPRLGHDPGLLVCEHVRRQDRRRGGRPLVGLGLTHPVALRYHAPGRYDDADVTAWFQGLVAACVRRGWHVALFTNGSSEDDRYLRRIGPALMRAFQPGLVSCVPRFGDPAELASFVSGLDLLMAHRLHANCTAYSYAVPHLGFTWDEKLENFFAMVDRSAFMCRTTVDAPEAIAALGARAMREGIDPVRHSAVLAAARRDVDDLAAALQGALADRRQAPRPRADVALSP